MKKLGFLSFGHWTPSPHSEVRTASDALLQSIELAVAAEELGLDGAYFRVHHFASSAHRSRSSPPSARARRRLRSGGPNSANLQATPSAQTVLLGRQQLDWLKAGLEDSRATWKVVAADMPLGLNVGDGATAEGLPRWEVVANGDPGAAKERELEFVELLAYLKQRRVRNVVWLTADVHYCAAHYYDPSKAAFRGFDPFWEFVAGPLNAGTFWSERPRWHVRASAGVRQGAAARTGQSLALQRPAVLGRGERRRTEPQSDGRFAHINGLSVVSQTLSPRGH